MPLERSGSDFSNNEEYRRKIREVFDKYNPVRKITERGPNYGTLLRSFEDRMQPGQTVTLFNYGSNSPEELEELFRKSGLNPKFGFGGQVQLKGVTYGFGSKSQARGCPVATLREGSETSSVSGYFALIDKNQFDLVSKRECGESRGRVKEKGRYRRAAIYFDDPRDSLTEMQAITFTLNELHPDLQEFPVDSEERIRQRLGNSVEAGKFREYTSLIEQQRRQTTSHQQDLLAGGPAVEAHWHSRVYRGGR